MQYFRFIISLCFANALFFWNQVSAQEWINDFKKVELYFNVEEIIPFKEIREGSVALLVDKPALFEPFIDMVNRYTPATAFSFNELSRGLVKADTLLIVVESRAVLPSRLQIIKQAMAVGKKVIICNFSGTVFQQLFDIGEVLVVNATELVAGGDSKLSQEMLAMGIFGGVSIAATANSLPTSKTRLQFASTEHVSALKIEEMTQQIDAIAAEAIREKATPGMLVMAIKDGEVVFEKAYGTHTYQAAVPTKLTDVFDLASISKVAGTTPAVMHLYDKGLLNLDSTIGCYLPELKGTDKGDITLRTVLLHEAGFVPFIPFYRTLKKDDLRREYAETHRVKVADSAYLRNNYYKEVMWPEMMSSTLNNQGKYVYSDISMYVMKEVVESITGQPMDQYVEGLLYRPIGMRSTGYNPRNRFEKDKVVPTQHDTLFRKVLLEGYVHDEGAAMAGGVAGHAGLFATAQDLAIYGQMLLNRGVYGQIQYFQPETVDLFTSSQSSVSRRGLGFDRADPDLKKEYPSKLAGQSVYGHTGYTGTCMWIDPDEQLIYIFLSNRVHPQVTSKLLDLNIRSRIQDVIYFYLL